MLRILQILLFLLAMLVFHKQDVAAQCPFTATVSTTTPILCPNDAALITTQTYDSYQWYRDGQLLPGQTNPTLSVGVDTGAVSYYSVLATLNGCSEFSDSVFIDGWVFLPVTVMSSGSYGVDPNTGDFIICDSTEADGADTIFFEIMQPYTTNVVWYNNGVPIPGANGVQLVVTSPGSYTVSGSPGICPNYTSFLGVTLNVSLKHPQHPVISLQGNQLVATPSWLTNWQWFLNGVALPGANSSTYTPLQDGSYTVSAQDTFCYAISQQAYQYSTTGIPERYTSQFSVFPNPATGNISLLGESVVRSVKLFDISGREVLWQSPGSKNPVLDVSTLAPGVYRMLVSSADVEEFLPLLIVR